MRAKKDAIAAWKSEKTVRANCMRHRSPDTSGKAKGEGEAAAEETENRPPRAPRRPSETIDRVAQKAQLRAWQHEKAAQTRRDQAAADAAARHAREKAQTAFLARQVRTPTLMTHPRHAHHSERWPVDARVVAGSIETVKGNASVQGVDPRADPAHGETRAADGVASNACGMAHPRPPESLGPSPRRRPHPAAGFLPGPDARRLGEACRPRTVAPRNGGDAAATSGDPADTDNHRDLGRRSCHGKTVRCVTFSALSTSPPTRV